MKEKNIYQLAGIVGKIIYLPCLWAYAFSKNKAIIAEDVDAWVGYRKQCFRDTDSYHTRIAKLLMMKPEFRSQFFFRIGGQMGMAMRAVYGGVDCLIERSADIKGGFVLMHGYGTVIGGGTKIGRSCFVLQNVTLGTAGGFPCLGDNVFIGAGAIVIGKISIGNDVKIGAGAIVVDDIPDGATVVCEKAKIIR